MKNVTLILTVAFFTCISHSQTIDFKTAEENLCNQFKAYKEADHDTRYTQLQSELKKHVTEVLLKPASFDYPFNE